MNLHRTQATLFKIYLNSGYRLAHRLDPVGFAAHLGLEGEEAEVIVNVSSVEIADFIGSLAWKRRRILESTVPITYGWVLDNEPDLITDFLSVAPLARSDDGNDLAVRFVAFLQESVHFYGTLPEALAEVGELELMLVHARGQQRPIADAEPMPGGDGFSASSWETIFWKPRRTSVKGFSTDPLPILLGKRDMRERGETSNILVAPSLSDTTPTVLRLVPTVLGVLVNLTEPLSGKELLRRCRQDGKKISETSLKTLLTSLVNMRVLDHKRMEAS
ncbi:hypothetical protein OG612_46010 (plasmid) [Streptomyces sp. NBC_01527]|uniref:hypothetical protein n=1 Tax=Streptomyces sp. NBC_01527 TaxID=2903894 RepID=UPI002F90B6D1